MNKSISKLTLTLAVLLLVFIRVNSQTSLPDELIYNQLTEQL
jgi:hypothetical protein